MGECGSLARSLSVACLRVWRACARWSVPSDVFGEALWACEGRMHASDVSAPRPISGSDVIAMEVIRARCFL